MSEGRNNVGGGYLREALDKFASSGASRRGGASSGEEQEIDAVALGGRFREVFEKAAVGMVLKDAGGSPIESNRALREMLGYSEEELRGINRSDFTHPEDAEKDAGFYAELFRGERESFWIEKRYVRKDGGVMWGRLSASVLTDDEGRPEVVIGVIEDVDGRRRAEEELTKSEGRFRGAFEEAPIGMSLVDLDNRYLRVNRAFCEAVGYREEDLSGKTSAEITHPDDIAASREYMERVVGGEDRGYGLEKRYLHADGHPVWMLLNVSLVRGAEGGLSHYVCHHQDITRRKQAEEDLRQSEERHRAVVEQSAEGIFLLDIDARRVVETNSSLREMLGYTADELRGMKLHNLIAHDREDVERSLRRTLEEGGRSVEERKYRRKDGTPVDVEVGGSVVYYGDKKVLCTVVRDVTGRKRMEEALRASERRFRTVIEQSPLSVHIFTPDGLSLVSNASWNELWNLKEGESPAGTSVFEDEQLASTGLLPYIEEGVKGVPVETPPLLYDPAESGREGSPRWLQSFVYPVRDEAGSISEIVLILEDITERREAAEELSRSEERFRSTLQNASDIITVLDPTGAILYESPAVERVLGYAPDERVGENAFGYVHPDDLWMAREACEEVAKRGGPQAVEYRSRHKDGSWRCLESVGSKPSGGLGEWPDGIVINTRDVTERVLAEEELRLKDRAISESSNAIVITDANQPDNPMVYVNPAFERDTGYAAEEAIGWNCRFLQGTDRDQPAIDELRAAVREERECTVVLRNYRKDGDLFYNEVAIYPVRDEVDGRLTHYVGVQEDITERVLAEEELKLKNRAVGDSSNGVQITGPAEEGTPILYVNPAWEAMTGYTAEEVAGRNPRFMQGKDRDQPDARRLNEAIAAGRDYFGVLRNYDKSGRLFYNETYVSPVRDEDGEITHWVGIHNDVTERERVQEELRLRNRALEAASNGVLITDMRQEDYPIVYFNPALEEITGYSEEEVTGRNPRFLQGADDDQVEARRLAVAIREEREWFGVLRNYKKDGTLFYNEMYVAPVRGDDGSLTHYVGIQNDVTERKAIEEQLAYQAFHDSLTGLPNRALFRDRLEQALSRAQRSGSAVAVLFMDLDNFKYVNDSLGHQTGDGLLVEVAERLRWATRPGDTAARLGGDEFAVLLEEIGGVRDAEKVAERVSEELRAPFALGDHEIFADASIGIALSTPEDAGAKDLLRDADAAMYEAKQEGKNRYKVFETSMGTRAGERLRLENALRRAVGRGEFRLHYQPKVLLKSGKTIGVEALLRWQHPEKGLVSPVEFIPLAEETGLIVPVGYWVLREACQQAKEWRERYAENGAELHGAPTVWVNLSARQFHQADLAGEISRVLAETGLPPEGLGLEITESVLMEYGGTAVAALDELKALGVKLAIDDFGTGYSSLSYLKRLPVDHLKIDRSFVAGLDKSAEDEVLVSAMINLAQALGLAVVAEGVETEDQLQKLVSLGCDFAQGYHFSRPLPVKEASELLFEKS